jgi:hypothetical protein
LRALNNKYSASLFYNTSSVIPISHLIKENQKRFSPFYNIFVDILIEPFAKDEAKELLSLGEFPSWLIDFIIKNIGTHPYLLQIIGWCAFNIQREKGTIREEDLIVLKEEFMIRARSYFDYFFNKFMNEKEKQIYKEIREANIEEQGRLINRYLISNPDEIKIL